MTKRYYFLTYIRGPIEKQLKRHIAYGHLRPYAIDDFIVLRKVFSIRAIFPDSKINHTGYIWRIRRMRQQFEAYLINFCYYNNWSVSCHCQKSLRFSTLAICDTNTTCDNELAFDMCLFFKKLINDISVILLLSLSISCYLYTVLNIYQSLLIKLAVFLSSNLRKSRIGNSICAHF